MLARPVCPSVGTVCMGYRPVCPSMGTECMGYRPVCTSMGTACMDYNRPVCPSVGTACMGYNRPVCPSMGTACMGDRPVCPSMGTACMDYKSHPNRAYIDHYDGCTCLSLLMTVTGCLKCYNCRCFNGFSFVCCFVVVTVIDSIRHHHTIGINMFCSHAFFFFSGGGTVSAEIKVPRGAGCGWRGGGGGGGGGGVGPKSQVQYWRGFLPVVTRAFFS